MGTGIDIPWVGGSIYNGRDINLFHIVYLTPNFEALIHCISNPLYMVFRTPYIWYFEPPTYGIWNPLPMVYRNPAYSILITYPYGISNSLPIVYLTATHGIFNHLPSVYRTLYM
jgi:hypothetical protein